MGGFSITGTEGLRDYAEDLGKVSRGVASEVDKVLEKGALKVKNELRDAAKGSTHFKGMAGSISYDRAGSASGLGYEIGPDKNRKGGALGNIYYFGTSRGGGSGDLEGPLMREAPEVYNQLSKLVDGWADRL